MGHRTWLRLTALFGALALVVSACGTDGDDDPDDAGAEPGTEEPADDDAPADDDEAAPAAGGDLIVGTTDEVISLDPARAYDHMSANMLYNMGEGLVGFRPGGSVPEPELAESWDISDDGLTYTFHLRDGIVFHNGSELTSEDVKFSLERTKNIDHPSGGAFLLGDIAGIETPDERTVEITIHEPNITFLSKLAASVALVVPADGSYDAPEAQLDAPGEDEEPVEHNQFLNEEFIGTGPYRLVEHIDGQSIELAAFEDYWGDAPANDRVLLRFFATSPQLKLALENEEVTVAYRTLSVGEREDLEANPDIQVIEGGFDVMRYIGFTPTLEPFDDPDVRRAVAAAIDRQRISDEVFGGAVSPLYSTILSGYEEVYRPAHEVYEAEGPEDYIDEPVSFTLHYGAERYGPEEPALAQEIARILNETGMFEVETVEHEWAEFVSAVNTEYPYPAFLLGWYPSYIDPEYYVTAFYGCEGWLQMWCDDEVEEWLAGQQAADDPASPERVSFFEEIQRKTAEEAWLVPMFEGVAFAYAQEGVTGVEDTLDASQIFRFWTISPGN